LNLALAVLPIFTAVMGAAAGATFRPLIEDYFAKRKKTLTVVTLEPFFNIDPSMFPNEVKDFGLQGSPTFVHRYSVSNGTKKIIKDGRIRVVDPRSDDTKIVVYAGFHDHVITKCDKGRFGLGENGIAIVHFEPGAMMDFVVYSDSSAPPKIFSDGDLYLRWPPFAYGYSYGYGYGYVPIRTEKNSGEIASG
jgi:hypothetical protein